MSTGDLNVNSVDRFRKNSDRLVLEQHGSCEVPAGCGGVVLRWHNPNEGRPVAFSCAVVGDADVFVNGAIIASRAILPVGENVIAVRISNADDRHPFIMAAWFDIPAADRGERDALELVVPDGCTAPDGTWRTSPEPFANDEWVQPQFDDSDWLPIRDTNESLPEENNWRFDGLTRQNGQYLRLPYSGTVCIRTTINIAEGES